MKAFNLLFISLLLSTFSFAQTKDFSGKITDENGQALERAWVLVLDANDNSYVTGTITDDFGYFEITDIQEGNFLVSVDHITFKQPKSLGILNSELHLNGIENMHLKSPESETILASAYSNSMYYNFEIPQK